MRGYRRGRSRTAHCRRREPRPPAPNSTPARRSARTFACDPPARCIRIDVASRLAARHAIACNWARAVRPMHAPKLSVAVLRRILDIGLGTVAAGGSLDVPFAVRRLVFDRLGTAGHALLGGGALRGGYRRGMGREGCRNHAI